MASYHRVPLSLSLVVLLCITASSCLKYTLLEEQAEATVVADIKTDSGLVAKYPDDIVNQLWFSFRQEGGIYDLFEIHPASGVIKTRQVIDRESLASCHHTRHCELELAISVKPLKYFEIIKITVEVVDINDNVPTFPERRISWSITETTRPGTRFVVPSAEDNDSGIYGIQKYNLTALTTSKFRLQLTNHTDGSIEVALVLVDTLDREHEQFYPIKITAWDGGEPEQSGSVLIDILIADANDNNPAFTNATYEVTVYENVQRDTVVAQVHAFDPDSGQNGEVSYSLAPNTQQELGDLFGIDNATGEIWVRGEVDYEQENSYELQVMASDLGPHSLPAFAKVNIRVLDVNDHGPEISFNTFVSSGHAEVAENADIGVFVAHVSVSDPDQGASGQFDCGLSSPLFTFEELGAADGSAEYMVVTATTFDREKQDQYRVTLTCTDRGDVPMSSSTRIVVDIMDANDHSPHFAQDVYMARLYENNDLNALITRLSASDSDSGGNGAIRYSIECLDPEEAVQDVVTIDAISGDIRAATVFDHETRQHYELVVVATDHAGLNSKSASTMLSLSIDDVNDEFPQFDQLVYAMEIKENLPANAHVGTVTATDKDGPLYNKIIYTIDNYLSHTDAFDINSRTGEIIATRGLDREQQANYTVIVFATNVGYPDVSTHVNVTISVIDDNDHDPQVLFPSPRNNTLQISTDLDIGHVITRVSATDADRGDNQVLHYAITNGNDEDLFAIDSQTGAITVAQHLQDYDQKAMKLVIVVEDSGQSPRNTIVDLNLLLAKPASAQSSLLQGSNFVILVGVVSGAVLIIVIIIISILCTRCRSRHNSKTYHYNCQVEANKRLSNGSLADSDSKDRHLDLSSAVDCDIVKDKDFTQVKKEVTFNVDQEDLYSLQPSWPLYAHEAGLLHQQPTRSRAEQEHHPHRRRGHHHRNDRRGHFPHLLDRAPAARGAPLPLRDMEPEVEPLNTDHDSESGSYTDSGRGASEEGDHAFRGYEESRSNSSPGDTSNDSLTTDAHHHLMPAPLPCKDKMAVTGTETMSMTDRCFPLLTHTQDTNSASKHLWAQPPPPPVTSVHMDYNNGYHGNTPGFYGCQPGYYGNQAPIVPKSTNKVVTAKPVKKAVRFAENCVDVTSAAAEGCISDLSKDEAVTSGSYVLDSTETELDLNTSSVV